MLTTYIRYLAIIPLLTITNQQAYSQQTQVRIVESRTLCLKRHQGHEKIYSISGRSAQSCLLPEESFSHRTQITLRNGRAYFFETEEDARNSLEKKKVIVLASVKVPPAYSKVLFYFTPIIKEGQKTYKIWVMNESYQSFPMGKTRALNLYSSLVRLDMGEHKNLKIRPRTFSLLPKIKQKDAYNMAQISCYFAGKKQWHKSSEFRKRFTDKKRTLIVAFIDKQSKKPQLRIYDDPQPASAEPPSGTGNTP